MQKIIIKNFGPVQSAEIELKKVLVLIGEQASGKSTISRLIYFFKTLRQDLVYQIYKNESELFNYQDHLVLLIKEKFHHFFGLSLHKTSFNIRFYYSIEKNKYINVSLDEHNKLKVIVSNIFLNDDFSEKLNDLIPQINYLEANDDGILTAKYLDNIFKLINQLFEDKIRYSLFVIAGRNVTVNYSDLFEKYLFAHVQSKIEQNEKQSLTEKSQTIEETLMLRFIQEIETIKRFFKKFEGFEGIIENYVTDNKKKKKLSFFKDKAAKILKGKYNIDNSGEKLILNERESVYLSNASSGQQEVIRILQDIFILIVSDSKALRIIEEPEAHLFPVAQKNLIELLAYMVNHDEDNQLIITTHSPYILAVFNNLLFANRVVEKNVAAEKEVNGIIEKEFWLSANDFSAYSLGNQSFGEDAAYCEPIFDTETGMIEQNYLDDVSEILGEDFQALMNIHAKTFAR